MHYGQVYVCSGGEIMGPENIWLVALGGLAAFIANVLYMVGGTKMSFGGQKWIRRFLGSFILAGAANGIAAALNAWVWQYLLIWPCLIGGFSLGYGSDLWWVRVWKRSIFALGVITAVFVGVWATGFTVSGWIVFGLAVVISATSVVLGVLNPFKNAPLEQFLISQVLTLFVPFLAWIR